MHPLPHGYSHDTRGNGTTVVKRYASEAASRRETEHRMLTALTGRLPVPPALAAPPGELRLARVPGAPGFDLIAAGRAPAVLRTCGAMLRRVQALDVADVLPGPYESGSVLVHGDYGPTTCSSPPTAGG